MSTHWTVRFCVVLLCCFIRTVAKGETIDTFGFVNTLSAGVFTSYGGTAGQIFTCPVTDGGTPGVFNQLDSFVVQLHRAELDTGMYPYFTWYMRAGVVRWDQGPVGPVLWESDATLVAGSSPYFFEPDVLLKEQEQYLFYLRGDAEANAQLTLPVTGIASLLGWFWSPQLADAYTGGHSLQDHMSDLAFIATFSPASAPVAGPIPVPLPSVAASALILLSAAFARGRGRRVTSGPASTASAGLIRLEGAAKE